MKGIVAYLVALALSLFNGKIVAGAVSGIILTPIVKPVERFAWVPRYAVPLIQGVAMGVVAVSTAQWLLPWFGFKMGWVMVALIIVGFVVIATSLARDVDQRHFHISAGIGELLGISLAGYHFLQ